MEWNTDISLSLWQYQLQKHSYFRSRVKIPCYFRWHVFLVSRSLFGLKPRRLFSLKPKDQWMAFSLDESAIRRCSGGKSPARSYSSRPRSPVPAPPSSSRPATIKLQSKPPGNRGSHSPSTRKRILCSKGFRRGMTTNLPDSRKIRRVMALWNFGLPMGIPWKSRIN